VELRLQSMESDLRAARGIFYRPQRLALLPVGSSTTYNLISSVTRSFASRLVPVTENDPAFVSTQHTASVMHIAGHVGLTRGALTARREFASAGQGGACAKPRR
jgi:hypothetical protein